MNRAYSSLTVKAVDEGRRIIRGIATTPAVDRVGDIIEPLGCKFANPLPLLWQHMHDKPIGSVTFGKPTKDGIPFTAELPVVDEDGALKARIDEAWQSMKLGLVRAVSIGFRAIEYSFMENGGVRFTECEIFELSAVTIPAQPEAVITSLKNMDAAAIAVIKKFDTNAPAATGQIERPVNMATIAKPAGVTAKTSKHKSTAVSLKGNTMARTIAEQIAALEAKRAANTARMTEVMEKSIEEDRSTDEGEQEEFDTLESEVDAIDKDLKRLRVLEKANKTAAKPVAGVEKEQDGAARRAGVQVKVKETLAPGIRFARMAKCIGLAKGNLMQAEHIATKLYERDEAVVNTIKAAVVAGSTGTGWGAALVGTDTSVYADFVEFLRPQTILGKFGQGGVPSLRSVPFRTALISQTDGGDGYWVGEGKPKPLTSFGASRTTLGPLKVASIAVATMELLRDSSPSADGLIRDSLAGALKERLDTDFIDPAKSASAGVSPASVTNGVSATASSGNDAASIREDIRALFGAFIAANNAPTSGVWIMSATTALALSLMLNPLGQREFPGISMGGGTFEGFPVIVSEYVPTVSAGSYVILANAQDIYLADEGGIDISMSTEASLEMKDSSLTQDALAGTGIAMVSMFQTNSAAFLAERTINWAKRRSTAVAVLNEVNWGQPGS